MYATFALFACAIIDFAIAATAPQNQVPFWITVELLSVEWRAGCLNTGGCGNPQFRLTAANRPITEQMSITWPIQGDLMQDSPHVFVSHWTSGRIADMTVVCEVVGVDPTYGFPRICDATSVTAIFDEEILAKQMLREATDSSSPSPSKKEKEAGLLVDLRGQCFNATLTVRPHIRRCPWCPDENEGAGRLVETDGGEKLIAVHSSKSKLSSLMSLSEENSIDELFNERLGVSILATITVISVAAVAVMLVIYLRQQKEEGKMRQKAIAAIDAQRIFHADRQIYAPIAHVLDGSEPLMRNESHLQPAMIRASVPYWYPTPIVPGASPPQSLSCKTILRMPKQNSTSSTGSGRSSTDTHSDSGVELA